jgi:hypothetical protein
MHSPLLWINQPPSLYIFSAIGIKLFLLKIENTFHILHLLAITTLTSTLIKLGIIVVMLHALLDGLTQLLHHPTMLLHLPLYALEWLGFTHSHTTPKKEKLLCPINLFMLQSIIHTILKN